MPNSLRVALYARVSTGNTHQDPEIQLRELREYASRRGWPVASEYVDRGVSGTKERRPQLDQLMRDAKRRKFDVVVVWRFDRFARSTKHLLTALEEFQSVGIDFVSYQEAIDTSTPMGKAMLTITGAIAALERDIICERVKAGLRHAKSKGKRLGRPRVGVDVQEIRSMQNAGKSLRAIASETGISLSSIVRSIRQAA